MTHAQFDACAFRIDAAASGAIIFSSRLREASFPIDLKGLQDIVCLDLGSMNLGPKASSAITTKEQRAMDSSLSVTPKTYDPQRSIVVSPRRIAESVKSRWLARMVAASLILVASPGADAAPSESTAISGTLTGPQTFAATSGTATITGNATLSGNVTFNLGFQVEYLVVGGGGGGKWGGGGGGQVVLGSSFLSSGTTGVTVGAGGRGDNATNNFSGTAGGSSVLGGITGSGGGIGSYYLDGGGSGGGYAGGSGIAVYNDFDQWRSAGGGGGAGGVGQNGVDDNGGLGGIGVNSTLTGVTVGYGGGGSGIKSYYNNMSIYGSVTYGQASIGYGGGAGGTTGAAGTSNTGGGGGGGATEGYYVAGSGGNGGSGFVAFRYLTGTGATGTVSGAGGTQSPGTGTAAGYTLVTYTSPDSAGSYALTQAQLDARLGATVTGSLTGSGGLSFAGPGILTLAGTNSYSGGTTVSAGKLLVNGSLTNSAVTVGGGGTLGGSGTLGALVTVQSGGVLSPGNSPGALAAAVLDLQAGSTTLMEVIGSGANAGVAGTHYDQIRITTPSSLSYGGNLVLSFISDPLFDNGAMFSLFSFTGMAGGGFTSVTTAAGSSSYSGLTFGRSANGNWYTPDTSRGQFLVFDPSSGRLTIVPEPSTWVLVCLGGAVVALKARRRTRAA